MRRMTGPNPQDQLVVRTNRGKLLPLFIPVLILGWGTGLLLSAVMVFFGVSLWRLRQHWFALLPAFVIVVNVLTWGFTTKQFVNRLRTDVALVLDREGVRLAHRPGRFAFLPWDALQPVTRQLRALRFRLKPGIGVDHPGITGLDSRLLRWSLRRTGLQAGLVGLSVDAETISQAVWYLSSGRVYVTR